MLSESKMRTLLRPWGLGCAGLALALGAGACSGNSEPKAPRNLLVIAVDTLRADALGIYGATDGRTPNLDRLGEAGIVFENAVSQASWTLPSFASTLTSTYSSTHGCWTFDARLPESFQTLPEVFQSAGFDTYGIASHIFFNKKYGLQQGFDDFDESLGHRANEAGWEPLTSPKVSARALKWLKGRVGNPAPWLLWLHYFDPHVPYVDHSRRTGGPAVTDERELYGNEIQFTDGFVGQVLSGLTEYGFAEETAVLFLSDHGEAFYEHPGVRRHSHSLYQEELRVPLVLKLPGFAPRRVPGLTRTVDLMPTLLEIFNLKAQPGQMIGHSLLPSLHGESQAVEPLLSEIRLKPAPKGKHKRAVLDGRMKLIEALDGSYLLYDQKTDALETHNLVLERPREVERLKELMQELEDEAVRHGESFAGAARVQNTADEASHIGALGYGTGEEGD